MIGAFKKSAVRYMDDGLMLAGAGLVSYGVWQIYDPAGWITAGAFCIAGAVIWSRGTGGEDHDIE